MEAPVTDFSWQNYWSGRQNGGHRFQSEDFFQKEAREKLYHLESGESLLDFGCGSADLTVYYANNFRHIVGVDFSRSMLENAKKRVEAFNCAGQISLIYSDDTMVWEKVKVPLSFDRITAGQVVQYFDHAKIDTFIGQAFSRLNVNGRLIFFDVIDPRIYYLFEVGMFGKERIGIVKIATRMMVSFLSKRLRRLQGLPAAEIGYAYRPQEIAGIARKYGLRSEVVWSMYYEYRYHLILTRDS